MIYLWLLPVDWTIAAFCFSAEDSLACNTPERCPSPVYAPICLENVVEISRQSDDENSNITRDPKKNDEQGSPNQDSGVLKDLRPEANPPTTSLTQDVSHMSKDCRLDVGYLLSNTQEVDQIQKDCRQEIDLIRKICRQEVETILKDCKREIELIQKDSRIELNCVPRDCKQEAGHLLLKDGRQEVERDYKQEVVSTSEDFRPETQRTSGDCKLEVDPILMDFKQEVEPTSKDCRREVNTIPKDGKRKAERNLKDCKWNADRVQKDWEQEDEVQQRYEVPSSKAAGIQLLNLQLR